MGNEFVSFDQVEKKKKQLFLWFWSYGSQPLAVGEEFFSFCLGWEEFIIFRVLESCRAMADCSRSPSQQNECYTAVCSCLWQWRQHTSDGAGQDGLNDGSVEVHTY